MWQLLNRQGLPCRRHRVARLRREAGIVALPPSALCAHRTGAATSRWGNSQSVESAVWGLGEESCLGG